MIVHAHDIAIGVGAGLLAAACGFVAERAKLGRRLPLGAFLVAGWLVALAAAGPPRFLGPHETHWVFPVAIAAIVVVARALYTFDRRHGETAVAPVLLLITIAGAFLATPDTEVLVLLGAAAAPVLALSLRRPGPYFGASAAPIAAVFIWAAAYEARGRPASFLAALACWGWLVLEPAAHLIPRTRLFRAVQAPRAVIVSHAVLVVASARWAGADRSVTITAVKVIFLAIAATVFMVGHV